MSNVKVYTTSDICMYVEWLCLRKSRALMSVSTMDESACEYAPITRALNTMDESACEYTPIALFIL